VPANLRLSIKLNSIVSNAFDIYFFRYITNNTSKVLITSPKWEELMTAGQSRAQGSS